MNALLERAARELVEREHETLVEMKRLAKKQEVRQKQADTRRSR